MEELLEEAKLRYPAGTKYKTAHSMSTGKPINIVEEQTFTLYSPEVIWAESSKGCLYYNGKWAEIITQEYELY